ncbi:hypothetical protein F4778DRAFT_188457 [Xylariomycetidae sp. FL2044]|nr:hypothetical protein F4778DRAFT_188457 [Xylariomycetidae sp. FL2044]
MPYSDDVYSVSDGVSDTDDYADQLSPSDGYFASSSSSNVVPHVPNILVPDPSLPTLDETSETSAASKAREANEERRLNTLRHQPSQAVESAPERGIGQLEQDTVTTAAFAPPPSRHHPTQTYSPSSSSRTTLRTYPIQQHRTPSVYSDAPPAYSPSPTSPLSPTSQQTRTVNYSTFTAPRMGILDVENERLLAAEPQSMGPPADEETGTPAWSRRVRRRLPGWLNWKTLLFAFVVLAVAIGLLANSFKTYKDDKKTTIRPAEPVEQQPVAEVPDTPDSPDSPADQAPSEPEPVTATPFEPTYCQNAQHRYSDQILALDFQKSQNISFFEEQSSRSGRQQVLVAGQVNVRRLDSGGDPRMVLEIVTNDPELLLDIFMNEEVQALEVDVPKKYTSSVPDQQPCVEMRATVWVPEDAEIGILNIGVTHLDILLLDDLSLHVAEYSRITSVTGDIGSGAEKPISYENPSITSEAPDYTFVPAKESYVFDSRVTEITTTSGKIEGNWPLYDMLGLHTTSGAIKVSITPEPELESDPKAAVLSLSSISGAVHATEPVHVQDQIPLRDYLVDIKSTSGGIHGAFAFGAGIELKSTASDIALDLLPVLNMGKVSATKPAQLETATTSGTTAVRVLEPLWFGEEASGGPQGDAPSDVPYIPIGDGDPYDLTPPTAPQGLGDPELKVSSVARAFNCLQALHKTTSGDIGLRYPQSWEGDLEAETTSGELKVRGKDVKIMKSSGWPGGKMKARKGPGSPGSTIQVHALMGTLDAVIGDEK